MDPNSWNIRWERRSPSLDNSSTNLSKIYVTWKNQTSMSTLKWKIWTVSSNLSSLASIFSRQLLKIKLRVICRQKITHTLHVQNQWESANWQTAVRTAECLSIPTKAESYQWWPLSTKPVLVIFPTPAKKICRKTDDQISSPIPNSAPDPK